MNVPLQIVLWMLGIILAFIGSIFSVAVHLLIRINTNIVALRLDYTDHKARIESLERHQRRGVAQVNADRAYLAREGQHA